MPDLLAPVSWWSTVASWARGLVRPRTELEVDQGAAYSEGIRAYSEYDPTTALSTFAAFPWVRACVDAIATDLAGLPWIASVGEGASARVLDSHPAVALLNSPTSWQTGEEWERQLWVDTLLTGNFYAAIVGRTPTSLPRLHPTQMRITPTSYGAPARYIAQNTGDEYEPEDMVHVRLSSWQDTANALLGEGLVRPLHDLLTAEQASQRLTAKAAARGRPEMLLRPKDGIGLWDQAMRDEIAKSYDAMMKQGRGALVLSDALEADFPTYTPRDLEFAAAGERSREAVLGVFGVPPARVGLPTANYATQEQQNIVYWRNLQGVARLVSGRLTRSLARRFPGQVVKLTKDFGSVEALQEARDARLDRVKKWVDLKMPAAAAAAYEGFTDAPGLDTAPADPAPQDATPPARGLTLLRGGETAAPEAPAVITRERLDVPQDDAGREALWRGFLSSLHTPTENAMEAAVTEDLARQRDALVARLETVPWPKRQARKVATRGLVEEILHALFPTADGTIPDDIRAIIEAAIRASFRQGAQYIGERYDYSPAMLDATIQQSIGSWARVAATTQDAVQAVVDRGIREGWTVYDMQRAMKDLPAFTPTRARVVARTETTRAVNGGAQDSYATAGLNGVDLRKQWLSARDLDVRFEHMELDGQQVHTGELFTVPSGPYVGATARFPGDFTAAALVVNCRCTTVPVVMGAR